MRTGAADRHDADGARPTSRSRSSAGPTSGWSASTTRTTSSSPTSRRGCAPLEARAPLRFELGDKGALLLVCDGMGGAAAGEVASQMAVDSIYEALHGVRAAAARRLRAPRCAAPSSAPTSASSTSRATTERARHGHDLHGRRRWSTTTLVVAQVGDSRCYILRDGKLAQVTKDQSLAWQLIEAGAMTAEEAKAFEHANIILQALGVQERVEVVLSQVELRQGDVALLCSDGLHGPVSRRGDPGGPRSRSRTSRRRAKR